MKFRIFRTSRSYENDGAPYTGAYIDKKEVDILGESRFHWAIDIGSLDELMKIVESEDQVVVSAPCPMYDNLPVIEIYDTYRE